MSKIEKISNAVPRYVQIAECIRGQIRNGQTLPGQKITTELEIASQYGVARGTVRKALYLLVDEGLLERQPGKGTFVTEQTRTDDCSRRIGVVVPFLRDSLTVDVLRGVEEYLREQNYSLIYSSSDGDVELECEQIHRLRQNKICGLILMPVSANDEAMKLSQVIPADLHTVLLDRAISGYQTSSVFSDNREGARQAVRHLLELGHRNIACVMHKGYVSSVSERVRGFEDEMRSAGIMPLAAIPVEWHGPTHEGLPPRFSPQELKTLLPLLDSPNRPTALFCVNDFTAFGVMQYLLERGIKIPDDISLVGFDDIPLAAFMPVPLTTVAQPKYEIGRQVAQVLLKMIEKNDSTLEQIRLPTSLVIRASTGPV